MKATVGTLLAVVIACLYAGCTAGTAVSVTTDRDPAAQFGRYKTYTLAPPKKGETLAAVSEAALRDSLRAEMAKRGLTEVSGRNADLYVARHVFIQERLAVQQYTDWGYGYGGGWPYAFGYYGMWPSAPVTYTDVKQFGEGTLILDFIDARSKKTVFRGVGRAVVGGASENAGKIREAVAQIVAAYPAQ